MMQDSDDIFEVIPDPERPDYWAVNATTYTQLYQGEPNGKDSVFSGPDAAVRAARYSDMLNTEVDADRLASGHIPPTVIFHGARMKTMTFSPDDNKAQVVITINRDQAKVLKGLIDVTSHGSFRLIVEPVAYQQPMPEDPEEAPPTGESPPAGDARPSGEPDGG